jgi:hypothetical protein
MAVDMVFKNGISQRAKAKAFGVSRQHVVQWCQGFKTAAMRRLNLNVVVGVQANKCF